MKELSLLGKFPALRTRNADELLAWLSPVFSVSILKMPDRGQSFDSIVNHHNLSALSLTYGTYGAPFQAHISHSDYFAQGFPVRGAGEIRWNKHSIVVDKYGLGVVGGPGSEATVAYGGSFAHLVLRISPAALTRKLSALIARPVEPKLDLTGRPAGNPRYSRAQLRYLQFLVSELDRSESVMPPIVIAEIEQAILVSYLMANEHNYSHWLNGTPRAAAAWQVRRAIDYIEANWDQPITIEALVDVTQTSARSLFHLFQRTYSQSPMAYVNGVRLRHARAMLSQPEPGASVTSVGFNCGFSNMGHFARKYYAAFGEKPSETLRHYR